MLRYHKGHPPRLRGWDYAAASAYFVTFNVADRRAVLGRVDAGRALPSAAGRVVHACWLRLPARFPGLGLDAMVVMPDHVHAILWLPGPGGAVAAPDDPSLTGSCGALVHQDEALIHPGGALVHQDEALFHQGGALPHQGPTARALMNQGPTARALMNQGPTAGNRLSPMMADRALLLGKVVRSWKAGAARDIRRTGIPDFAWQSRYYEHVVRAAGTLARVRAYIRANPRRA